MGPTPQRAKRRRSAASLAARAGFVAAALLGGLLALPAAATAGVGFGARTQIWPFLFGTEGSLTADEAVKLDVAMGNLDRYRELGATWNIVDVWQEADGPDGYRRLDHVIAQHEARGIQVALRLLETPEIYDAIAAGGRTADAALDAYREWVGGLARHVGAKARYYLISNEVDHDIGYNRPSYRAFRHVRPEEYRSLLHAAYDTIHAVDPRLVVADQGTSSWSVALAVMGDMVASGDLTGALAFWRAMDYHSPGDAQRTVPRLLAMLAGADSRRRMGFARAATGGMRSSRDVFQFHHYHGPAVLPATLRWIREQGVTEPIVATEVGFLIPTRKGKSWDGREINVADMARYVPGAHAASVAAVLATLAGSGVRDILYWQLRFHVDRDPAASLFPPASGRNDFSAGPPARAFAFAARMLGEAVPAPAPSRVPEGVTEFRFQGASLFSVIWSASGSFTLDAGLRGRVTGVADVAGTAIAPGDWDGQVGPSPLYVTWRP